MSRDWQGKTGGADELGRDAELASLLEFADPASRDPHYWLRFQSRILKRASAELARRRIMADVTVGEVLSSWARTVVPTAIFAALVAGLVLVRGHTAPRPASVGVEELLVAGIDDQSIPAALQADSEEASQVAFAGERF